MRHRLDPFVYKDFIQRVAILGGESTGKTTLAKQLAEHTATAYAAEYGRELWEARNGALVQADMLHIADTQIKREETRMLKARRFVFCDTTPLTTQLYSQAIFGHVPDELEVLARRPYDLVLLCSPDVPFIQDGTRRDDAFRQWQHHWYLHELSDRSVQYQLLQGSWQQRIATAIEFISASGTNSIHSVPATAHSLLTTL